MGSRARVGFKQVAAVSLCLPLLLSCQPSKSPQGQRAIVQRAVSGQTLEAIAPSKSAPLIETIRLSEITAPDLRQQPWGEDARRELAQLLGRKATVVLEFETEEADRFGRRRAYVWHEGTLVNETLVAKGYALVEARSPQSPYRQRLLRAQESARLMGYGIWNPQHPLRQTPAEFRARSR